MIQVSFLQIHTATRFPRQARIHHHEEKEESSSYPFLHVLVGVGAPPSHSNNICTSSRHTSAPRSLHSTAVCEYMHVRCICWRPSLNLPALIRAERRAKVNSSAGLMDGDKDDSQMESANRSRALDKRGPKSLKRSLC